MKMKKRFCPECGSVMSKSGVRVINRSGTRKQQWRCPACRRRTLNPLDFKISVPAASAV